MTDADLEGQFDLIINWVMAALNATTGHTHDGSSNNGPKIPITNLTVPSQAQGDLIYASSASAWARLGYGTSGQFLKTQGVGANPIWADITMADQTSMETATSTTDHVSPGRQHFHPGMAKAWCMFNGTTAGTNAPTVGYGVTSVTRNSTGNYTINLSVTFSSANFAVLATCNFHSGSGNRHVVQVTGRTATTITVKTYNDAAALADNDIISVMAYGDF